jgi:predicted RNA-binding Zn-ribbon protein involved in translation (DUF1610 family)
MPATASIASSVERRPEVLALRCPSCGEALPTRTQMRIWVCPSCATTSMASGRDGEGFQVLERTLVAPQEEFSREEKLYLFPVWSINDRDQGDVRIPATGLERMPLLLSLAQRLTQAQSPWSVWNVARHLPRAGADLHVEEAFAMAELLRRNAEDLVERAGPRFGGARLLDWPCVSRSSQLVELVGGRAASGRLLEGLQPVARGPELAALSTVPPA